MVVHSIGEVIRKAGTRELGRVVRIVALSEIFPKMEPERQQERAYIVALMHPPATQREALWFQEEVAAAEPGSFVGDPSASLDANPEDSGLKL